jgi:hypothetical protein
MPLYGSSQILISTCEEQSYTPVPLHLSGICDRIVELSSSTWVDLSKGGFRQKAMEAR